MNTNMADSLVVELYCKENGRALSPHLVRSLIAIQRGWRSDRNNADAQQGFLATEFTEDEVQSLYQSGGNFFLLCNPETILGFALTTSIDKFTEQFESAACGQLKTSSPLLLAEFNYLYQVAILKGEHQRGLGRRLVKQAQKHHIKSLLADVLVSPVPNLGSSLFFARLGFRKVGTLELDNYRDYGPLVSEVLIG